MDTVAAMKEGNKALKASFKGFSIAELEDLHDDMSELMADAGEIQDVLGRSYDVGDEIDEDELNAELDALEGEMEEEGVAEGGASYLDVLPSSGAGMLAPTVPNTIIPSGSLAEREKAALSKGETDAFGLPIV